NPRCLNPLSPFHQMIAFAPIRCVTFFWERNLQEKTVLSPLCWPFRFLSESWGCIGSFSAPLLMYRYFISPQSAAVSVSCLLSIFVCSYSTAIRKSTQAIRGFLCG